MPYDSVHPDRHHRQRILPEIGDAGQERLRLAHAAIIGCGALGTHLADTLCRAGVGWLTIIDRDIVEHTNLQRQILFTEDHAIRGVPKAQAAKETLHAIDPNCNVRAIVDDLSANNIDDLLALDGDAISSPSRPAGGDKGRATPPTHSSKPRRADDDRDSEKWVDTEPPPQSSPAGRRRRQSEPRPSGSGAPPITLLLDGTDNFETRFLLNDLAIARTIPLVYAGVIGTTGLMTAVLPPDPNRARKEAASPIASANATHSSESCATNPSPSRPAGGEQGEGSNPAPLPSTPTPCLRCLFDDAPPPGSAPTCDTAGVLGPAVSIIAGFQSAEALKILTGDFASVTRALLEIDAWRTTTRRIDTTNARNPDCPCCAHHHFDYLDNINASSAVSLCGRNAVQITPGARAAINLPALAARLAPHGDFHTTDHLLRGVLHTEPIELTVFPTGRAIIKGVDDAGKARAIYARFVGA